MFDLGKDLLVLYQICMLNKSKNQELVARLHLKSGRFRKKKKKSSKGCEPINFWAT